MEKDKDNTDTLMPVPGDWGEFKEFSANGVPWPLDEWLMSRRLPTTDDIVKIIRKW